MKHCENERPGSCRGFKGVPLSWRPAAEHKPEFAHHEELLVVLRDTRNGYVVQHLRACSDDVNPPIFTDVPSECDTNLDWGDVSWWMPLDDVTRKLPTL